MKQDNFALCIVGDIAESLLFLPLDLLGLAAVLVRMELRHEPDKVAAMAVGVGICLLLVTHGGTLAAFYPFAWVARMWRTLFHTTHNGAKAAREEAIRAANSLRYTSEMISDRAREDVAK